MPDPAPYFQQSLERFKNWEAHCKQCAECKRGPKCSAGVELWRAWAHYDAITGKIT